MFKRLLLPVVLLSSAVVFAQGRLLLDEEAARKNLVQSTPAIAPLGVHATGKVVLLVEISPEGRVVSAKPDTGNSRLREAAVEAVKTWRFKPFMVHGAKVAADTKLTVEFGGKPAEVTVPKPAAEATKAPAAVPNFAALEDRCKTLVETRAEPAQETAACRAAADAADNLYGEGTWMPRRAAYVFAATAFMRADNLKAAVAYGSKAVAAIAEGHDDDAGSSAAYTVRGQAKAFAGDLPGADLDLIKAEGFERKVLAAETGKPEEPAARQAMKNLLLFHAKVLTALKQTDKAAAKTAEAQKL